MDQFDREELIFATYDLFIAWHTKQPFMQPLPYRFRIEGESFRDIDAVWDKFVPEQGWCPDCLEKIGSNDDCFWCRDWAREHMENNA
jgi:hypothetical protein